MATPSKTKKAAQTQAEVARNDPDETNDPKPIRGDRGDFEAHIWNSINQIFERLGKIGEKIDQISVEQGALKESVEKHDKMITRAIFTVGGAIFMLVAFWFIYSNFLKDHITFR